MTSIGRIVACKFTISKNLQQEKEASVIVTEKSSFVNGCPIYHGLADPGFGPVNNHYSCTTCGHSQTLCQKHNGIFELKYPIADPKMVAEIGLWLRCVCPWCGQFIINPKSIPGFNESGDKLKYMVAHLKLNLATLIKKKPAALQDAIYKCHNHPTAKYMPIYIPDKDNRRLYRVVRYEFGLDKSAVLHDNTIYMIFNQIPAASVTLMGRKTHPVEHIRHHILIPPVNLRVNALSMINIKQSHDTAMHMLSTIIQEGSKVLPPQPEERSIENALNFGLEYDKDTANYERIQIRNSVLDSYSIFQTGTSAVKKAQTAKIPGMTSFFLGKTGYLRAHRRGNRKHRRGRAVIYCEPNIKIDEILIPRYMAERMYIIEYVTEHNFSIMYKYLRNGTSYPGCVQIVKSDGTYIIDKNNRDTFTLDVGDEIHRHLVTGDKVIVNRQPTTLLCSVVMHTVVVNPNPNVYSMGLNPCICVFYGADFDGDAMLVVPINTVAARVECAILNPVKQFYISEQFSQPRIALGQDGITMMAELTRSTSKFTRSEAMCMFDSIVIPSGNEWHGQPIFDKWGTGPADYVYSGREILSMILPKINYKAKSSIGKSNIIGLLNVPKSDIEVIVEHGVIKSGVFDKAIVGSNTNSILHHIYSVFGIDVCMVTLDNMLVLGMTFAHVRNFTISPLDFHVAAEDRAEIRNRVRAVVARGSILEQQYYDGAIVPPRGMSISEYYEQQSIQYLKDDYMDLIVKSLQDSHLVKIIVYGAKGSVNNLNSICGAIGQVMVGSARPTRSFKPGQLSVFSHQFDFSPLALGFIPDNYTVGQQPKDYYTDSMNGRDGITRKAIITGTAGHMGRMFSRSLGNINPDIRLTLRVGDRRIQLSVNDCGYDLRRVVITEIPGVKMSRLEFEQTYKYTNGGKHQHIFDDEYNELSRCRVDYIKIMLEMEILSSTYNGNIAEQHLPVDLKVALASIQLHKLENPVDVGTLIKMRIEVEKLVRRIPYLAYAPKYWDNAHNQMEIPRYVLSSHSFFLYYLQLQLASTKLQYYTPDTLDKLIIVIQQKFIKTLVRPGTPVGGIVAMSIGEIFTQSALNSIHATGSSRITSYTLQDSRDFIKAVDTSESGTAKMVMRLKPEFEHDYIAVRRVTAQIQLSKLSDYVDRYQLFYEEFGNPIHPDYIHEKGIYEQYKKNTTVTNFPQMEWLCFRISLSIEKLLDRNITVAEIVSKLQQNYPQLYIIATYETDRKFGPVIRAHPIKGKSTWVNIMKKTEKFYHEYLDTDIRGVSGISQVSETQTRVHKWDEANGKVIDDNIYIIMTRGSNVPGVLSICEIDHELTQTTSVHETQRLLGTTAAKTKIMTEFAKIVPEINKRHYSVLASHLMATGTFTAVSATGQLRREPTDVLSNACIGGAYSILHKACINETTNKLYGPSASAVMGQRMLLGTGSVTVGIDEEMIIKHAHKYRSSRINSVIDDLDELN